jgi:ribonuclease PH
MRVSLCEASAAGAMLQPVNLWANSWKHRTGSGHVPAGNTFVVCFVLYL